MYQDQRYMSMNDSTVIEWLDENGLRSYPFTEDMARYIKIGETTVDIYSIILDAALQYRVLPDVVKIEYIDTTGGNLTIKITGNEQAAHSVSGYAAIPDSSFPLYVYNSSNSLLVIGIKVKDIPSNIHVTPINAIFIPSVITEIDSYASGVDSLTIGEIECDEQTTIVDGYQCSVIPVNQDINLEIGRNEGLVLPCNFSVSSVQSDCADVASLINGAAPNDSGDIINFVAGNHVKIFDDPINNRIYIGYDFSDREVLSTPSPQTVIYETDVLVESVIP
jgi:hypothetical protein